MSGAMLMALSFGLALFINLSASIELDSNTIALPPNLVIESGGELRAGEPTPTAISLSGITSEPVTAGDINPIRQDLLGRIRITSLIGLGIIALLGAIGAYWLAGRALHPLRNVARSAQHISVGTLDTRLELKGPEDEIKELVAAFNTMLGRLERSFDQQGQFVNNAAHELRTPLTTLRTNLQVMYSDSEATVEDYREMAPVLDRTVTRFEHLISDLLLLAKEESKAREEVALMPLVGVVLGDLEPVAHRQHVKLNFRGEADVRVLGNGSLLARVFSNLVENGIRYNHEGGEVDVTVGRGEGCAIVTIADTGIGIASEEQPRIFDRFYRVDRSRSRNKGGAGLGLSIVAHILQIHGGKVEVESTPGIGSRFTVQIPL
jgi:two-component system sensor histidine kinase ArlS